MKVVEQVIELRSLIHQQRLQNKRIVFVPTMGNLHQGHLQLVARARQLGDYVVASIFVNPMQFGAGEDFDKYPRTHQADIEQLTAAQCDLLFLPAVETIYPLPVEQQTRVEVPFISNILCGASRPGHFVGVSTVVCKLFNLVQPDVAVFGEKDFQQLMVIRRMVEDLCMPVEIIGAPIVREKDGLAMSSRNGYLTAEQRRQAPALQAAMQQIQQHLQKTANDFPALEALLLEQLDAAGFKTDYVAFRRASDLQIPTAADQDIVLLVAAYLGTTRLIDNLPIKLA